MICWKNNLSTFEDCQWWFTFIKFQEFVAYFLAINNSHDLLPFKSQVTGAVGVFLILGK